MSKIYCVEDDSNIRELIEYTLSQSGFEMQGFENGAEFYDAMKKDVPDLILLDIMLPDKDGMQILDELKKSEKTKLIPVIMLTAKSGQMEKIKGLDAGADDYITKPFDVLELISRVKAVLRRVSKEDKKDIIEYSDIYVDVGKRTVKVKNELVTLTYKEFELLVLLLRNIGIVLDRDTIMNKVWDINFESETRTVDVHIRTLRQKLKDCGRLIETVRNVGYRIK